MIAIDTNVLLRYLLRDDASQAAKAESLILGLTPVLVTDVVLAEVLWTLKGPKYQASREDLIAAVENLIREPNIRFEHAPTIWRALHDYRRAKSVKVGGKRKRADFADALIVNKARMTAHRAGEAWEGLYTFDVAAQIIDGAKAL